MVFIGSGGEIFILSVNPIFFLSFSEKETMLLLRNGS